MGRKEDIKQLIYNRERRLQKLREQQALTGASTEPQILIEIEDIEEKIAELQTELKLLEGPDITKGSKIKPLHNLPPPTYGRFVGRKTELDKIIHILRPHPYPQHTLVAIDGVGGIGKSTLASGVGYHYLHNYEIIPSTERFEAIVWVSAQQAILTPEGTIPRRQVLRTLDDIYKAIAWTLEREEITRADPEEQDAVVQRVLTQQRTLLIIDNLETVDDETVTSFLYELPMQTKAIITTRHRIDLAAYQVRLQGLSWEDAQTLIEQECQKKSVDLDKDAAYHLYEYTGGIPLAMVWGIAQMGFGHRIPAVLTRMSEPHGDICRFLFEKMMEEINDKPAHKLLIVLSLFATDAKHEAIGYIADLSELDRDDGLVELEKLSLLYREGDRFHMLPLTKVYTAALFLQDPIVETNFRDRQANYYLMSIPYPSSFPTYTAELASQVKGELQNILHLLEWCERQTRQDTLLELFLRIHDFLGVFGRLDIRSRWTERTIEIAEGVKRISELGRLYTAMGWMDMKQGDSDKARHSFKKALQMVKQSGDRELECLTLRYQARLEENSGTTEKTRKIRMKALAIAEGKGFKGIVAALKSDIAYWEMKYESLNKAETYMREAIAGFEDINDAVRASDRAIMLANILVRRDKYDEAKRILISSLSRLENQFEQKEAVASGYACFAHIYAHQGNISEALASCTYAKQIYAKVGIQREAFPIGLPAVCSE